MKCSVCGRKLRNPTSQEVGYGPVCYGRLFGTSLRAGSKNSRSSEDADSCHEMPGQMSLEDYLPPVSAE